MEKIVFIYLIVVNLIAFLLYGIDKQKAKKQAFRIPEIQLMTIAVIGGSIGAYLGMRLFHHKTKHMKFYLGIPAIIVIQVGIIGYMIK